MSYHIEKIEFLIKLCGMFITWLGLCKWDYFKFTQWNVYYWPLCVHCCAILCCVVIYRCVCTMACKAMYMALSSLGMALIKSPGDGHCLIHLLITSWNKQLPSMKPIDGELVKNKIC